VPNRPARRQQPHTGREEGLGALEPYAGPVREPPLGAAPPRVRQGRANQVGPRPAIAVAGDDPHRPADPRPPGAPAGPPPPVRQRRGTRPLREGGEAAAAGGPARRPRARFARGVFGGAHATDDLARRRTTRPRRRRSAREVTRR